MGGLGSGSYGVGRKLSKDIVERAVCIDIREFKRCRYLREELRSRYAGYGISAIKLFYSGDKLYMDYSVYNPRLSRAAPMSLSVDIDWTRCNF